VSWSRLEYLESDLLHGISTTAQGERDTKNSATFLGFVIEFSSLAIQVEKCLVLIERTAAGSSWATS
jgi:hypothetical protein